jgi:phosphopentomutase
MIYGHRNDAPGYARALEEFDACLPEFMNRMHAEDMLILSADHGVDPTTPGTDHSREHVPLIVYTPQNSRNVDLGTRSTIADIGATIAEIFKTPAPEIGVSFLKHFQA